MNYRVEIAATALKQLKKLEPSLIKRIQVVLEALADEPRPAGVKKLRGMRNAYRVRVGDYRIVYFIEDQRLLVTVIKVAHRRTVYR